MAKWTLLFLIVLAGAARADIHWYWQDDFDSAERAKLLAWVEHSRTGLSRLFGEIPLRFHVHFSRMSSHREPVPWAHTNKGGGASVYFHVDTRYSLAAFKSDWTAPHELAHLLLPYLGEDSRWFAEGIASYLQYPIMYASGTLSWDSATERYRERFERAANMRGYDRYSIVDLSRRTGRQSAYVRFYWGGAAYFAHVDRRLARATGRRLVDILRDYVHCCYQPWGIDAPGLMRKLDTLSATAIFTETYHDTVARAGFPPTAAVLDWLRSHPPELDRPEK